IKYFEDPALKVMHAGQAGSFPYPDEDGLRRDRQMSETRETVERLRQELQEVRAGGASQENATSASSPQTAATAGKRKAIASSSIASSSRGRSARAGASAGPARLNLDLGRLGIPERDRIVLASAVQTTRSIIKEHS
ncbi:hypothetical protein LCGC14_1707180, partial [marine sediment metagenome]